MTYCILNGEIVPEKDAVVSIHDRGFRFGDGVFETIAVHKTVPYQLEWHIKRLADGANALKMSFNHRVLPNFCAQLIAKNNVTSGILRIQVTRGIGSRGYLPDSSHPEAGARFVIETAPMPIIPFEPVALWQSSYTKISPRALPVHYKLCQGVNSTLARMEAAEHHCAEALLLNESGELCEASSGNIFWVKDEMLYTPAFDCGVLHGSTRDAILRLSSYPVSEVKATLETLLQADEVFMCNIVWVVIPIGKLAPNGKQWRSGPITEAIRKLLLHDRDNFVKQGA